MIDRRQKLFSAKRRVLFSSSDPIKTRKQRIRVKEGEMSDELLKKINKNWDFGKEREDFFLGVDFVG